jgi:23S rRNA G2445 N2-methylase RlmL
MSEPEIQYRAYLDEDGKWVTVRISPKPIPRGIYRESALPGPLPNHDPGDEDRE